MSAPERLEEREASPELGPLGVETGGRLLRVGPLADLRPNEPVRVEGEEPIAVFNVDGELFAVSDTCTHAEASLSEGFVDGAVVECPFHFARFCLRTGRALSLPATQALRTYAVVVRDGIVWVEP